jgi:hypothetical protein
MEQSTYWKIALSTGVGLAFIAFILGKYAFLLIASIHEYSL